MHEHIEEILVTAEEIDVLCRKLGTKLTHDYRGKKPILVGLLNGCVPFMSKLMMSIETPLEIEFMAVSSYHGGVASTGDVKIKYDLETSVSGRDVLIVEDIVDTGATLDVITKLLKHRGAKSIEVVTLLDKPEGRKIDFIPKYIGKTIPKKFVVGFGLDYQELYRNLPYVGVLKPEVYEK